jgi:hypothetical protein
MNSKALGWTARAIAVLALAAGIGASAQDPIQTFSGVIDAYSPQTAATLTAPATGPYEIHGPWTLRLNRYTGRANFSAALDMKLSDGWVLTLNNGNFDPNARGAHTHHITMVNADVTWLANGAFEVSGSATITLNGSPAPVSPSPLVIDITGGTDLEHSNVKLTFGSPGSRHFGAEPLPGVVSSIKD